MPKVTYPTETVCRPIARPPALHQKNACKECDRSMPDKMMEMNNDMKMEPDSDGDE